MPGPNQKSVTIPERIYKQAEQKAKKKKQSVAGFVSECIEEKTGEASS